MRINQNVMANNAARNLAGTNLQLGKSLEKLSSGFRINRAADDAAGLVISQGLRAQVGGLKQATRNALDGISVVQTAEGALNEVHTMLNRMRDLSVQAANSGGNDGAAKAAAQAEISALSTEIDRISSSTRFGGVRLIDGTFGATTPGTTTPSTLSTSLRMSFDSASEHFNLTVAGGTVDVTFFTPPSQTGPQFAPQLQAGIQAALAGGNPAQQALAGNVTVTSTGAGPWSLQIAIGGMADGSTFSITNGTPTNMLPFIGITSGATSSATTTTPATTNGGNFQVGANSGETVHLAIGSMSASSLGVNALNVTTDLGAAAAITAMDSAISTVSTTRGNLGAMQNRFESMVANLQATTENLAASESRIRDTDMAQEMVSFTKTNVLLQAGTAMLSQANQVPQSILSLLR